MIDEIKCLFCDLGQAKRILIWRLVKDMSKKEIQEKINEREFKKKIENGKRKT